MSHISQKGIARFQNKHYHNFWNFNLMESVVLKGVTFCKMDNIISKQHIRRTKQSPHYTFR